ncbi:Uncharacterised protein [Anaerotruncus sp. 2789STDY5834896]|uniref:Uncharacterized protein n=1 Tax=uncultured Anaerotruncus sp. TaxID=905011 RepID=A0A1C6FQC9_9FIRM|nr:Uncharacterised protein [uncultured Anaerotruncus sp.]
MEFTEYIKIKQRMVKYNLKMRACMEDCGECAFHTQNNGLKCHCSDVELIDPELAENIVRQWAKEHPAKTYAQDFLSKFPKAPKDNYGTPAACRKTIYGGSCIDNADCEDCWNEPMEEDPAHE